LVTNVLLLPVLLHQPRVRFPPLLLVVGVFVPPLLPAIAHHLAILEIRRQLLAARIRAALALTIRPTANSLLETVPRRQKQASAVKTAAGLVHVGSSGIEHRRSLRRIEMLKRGQEKSEMAIRRNSQDLTLHAVLSDEGAIVRQPLR
jgi:hypothetical protein